MDRWRGTIISNLIELLKIAKSKGIINNLLTNGKELSKERIIELEPYLDYITLSYDSNNSDTYKIMGRGEGHGAKVIEILDFVKRNDIE